MNAIWFRGRMKMRLALLAIVCMASSITTVAQTNQGDSTPGSPINANQVAILHWYSANQTATFPVASTQPGMTDQPSLPNLTILTVPAGQILLFEARAKGVQIYPCDATTHKFGSPHPEAILVTHKGEIIHHTKGPTWTAADGSFVTGTKLQSVAAPAEDAIPWLLLSTTPGRTPKGMLSNVSYIQRVYTKHGNPPEHGCGADDAGKEKPVFYEAEYFFYAPKS